MAAFSRHPHEHWLKPHFSKNEVANSGSELPVNTLGFFCAGEGYADISAFTRRTFGMMFNFR